MTQSSRAELTSPSMVSSPPANTAAMIPIIINNCEYFLSREADVQVITEHDESSGIWKAHAVHFTGIKRIPVATGTGKTDAEAIDALHKATAQGVRRFNEVTGMLQSGQAYLASVTGKPSLPAKHLETKPVFDSSAKPSDLDDVISLPSDDEESLAESTAEKNWDYLFEGYRRERQKLQGDYMQEYRNQLKQRNGNLCTTPPDVPEPPMARKASQKAVSLRSSAFPGLPSAPETPPGRNADTPTESAARSNAETRWRRRPSLDFTPGPPKTAENKVIRPLPHHAHLKPASPKGVTYHGQHEGPLNTESILSTDLRTVILNVIWVGRRGILRNEHRCRLHTSVLKDVACNLAIFNSHQFTGQSVPTVMDRPTHYITSSDGHTNLVATIRRFRQGGRQMAVPISAGDVSEMVSAQGMPEFDVEVLQVLP